MSFNECIETIKDKAVEGAQTAVRKTKQLAGIAKANLDIRAEEEKIKKAQMELGKLYYKDYIVGEEPDAAEYTPWCEKISESKIAIEDLKIAIEELRAAGAKCEEACGAEDVCEAPCEEEDAPAACCCEDAPAEEDAPCCCCEEAPAETEEETPEA